MASKVKNQEEVRQENVEAAVSKTEQFYNSNKKLIWGVVAAVVVVGLLVLAWEKFIYEPKCNEAMEQTYPAEMSFQQGNYELALNGDGNVLGFAQSIEQYGNKAGEAVYAYAGICALQLGNYEEALGYLKKYNGKEPVLAARVIACQGDAYVGLEDYKAAVACFEKAAAKADNLFAASYLLKAGLVYEKLGDKAAAKAAYETIKDKYPQSVEGFEIDRYISEAE